MASILPHNYTKYYTLKEYWHRPVTKFYSDNYGYAVNFYQPMIDYLDDKSANRELPHLPFVNERGLTKYRPSKTIKHYSTQDLDNFANEAQSKAKENLKYQIQDFIPVPRDAGAVIQAEVNSSRLLKHLKGAETNKDVIDKNIRNRRKIREDMAEKMRIKSAFSISKKLFTEAQKRILENSMSPEDVRTADRYQYSSYKRALDQDDYNVNLNGEETIERTLQPIRREIRALDNKSNEMNVYQRYLQRSACPLSITLLPAR
uniref:Paramyosin, short form n=1 Tax=Cacopsylla melanoneura TaxID=428564 RepID=A0A8D8VFI9_9HEMI